MPKLIGTAGGWVGCRGACRGQAPAGCWRRRPPLTATLTAAASCTCALVDRLDNRHVVFGEVLEGFEVGGCGGWLWGGGWGGGGGGGGVCVWVVGGLGGVGGVRVCVCVGGGGIAVVGVHRYVVTDVCCTPAACTLHRPLPPLACHRWPAHTLRAATVRALLSVLRRRAACEQDRELPYRPHGQAQGCCGH